VTHPQKVQLQNHRITQNGRGWKGPLWVIHYFAVLPFPWSPAKFYFFFATLKILVTGAFSIFVINHWWINLNTREL